MSKSSFSRLNLSSHTQRHLLFPAAIIGGAVFITMIIRGLVFGTETGIGKTGVLIGTIGLAYITLTTVFGGRIHIKFPWSDWIFAVINGVIIGVIEIREQYLLPGTTIPLSLMFITFLSLMAGRWPTYGFVLIVLGFVIATAQNNALDFSYLTFLKLILIPVIGLVTCETILRMRKSLLIEMKRLETLNSVARSLATSLEMHQVVSLVSSAIQNALDADTYYLGLLRGDTLHMELFFDDGEFFPSMDIPHKDTLAGIVLGTRQPLFISDLVSERKKRKLPFIIVGRPKVSLSWMGTPLESGGTIVGLIAVASYQKHAFDKGDMNLLVNIGQQAAMAFTNASRHAEVETKSQNDSLTNVLNHNTFLIRLERQVRETMEAGQPHSLIMLDVDNFKRYNDVYGHVTGDEVLVTLCQVIKQNIKKGDLIGRWGGEEFVISLPNATAAQAYLVADRIRKLLATSFIRDRNQQVIQAPTVSQGIAQYTAETGDFMRLVDAADQQLYIAKGCGGNQIEPCMVDLMDRFEVLAEEACD